jgi:glutamate-ammonia-ligase adenylyltransferase
MLSQPRDAAKIRRDVADMRGLMERERAAKSIWGLKLTPGGLVDVEFIAQALQLTVAASVPHVLSANTGEALERLAAAGALEPAAFTRLRQAWRAWTDLRQTLRICVAGAFDPDQAPPPLRQRLTALLGASDFAALETMMRAIQAAVRADFVQIVGPLGDGSQPVQR